MDLGSLQSMDVDGRSHGEPPFWAPIVEAQWNIEESMSHLPKVRMKANMNEHDK